MRFLSGRGAYVILVTAILAGALVLRIADPFFVQALRLIAFDSYQRLAPQSFNPALPVRVVDIDEESLAKIGQWPWPRTIMADLVTKLAGEGAAVTAFDILFPEPDQSSPEVVVQRLTPDEAALLAPAIAGHEGHDAVFAKALAAAPTVLATALTNRPSAMPLPQKAGFAVAGDDPRPFIANLPGATSNLAVLDDAATGIGSINWVPDRDQVIRRIPLLYRRGDDYVPALSIEALRVAEGASTYVLKASNSSGETAFGEATGLNHIKVSDAEIPTDADGGIWLQFRPSNPGAYIPAWKVLSGVNDPKDVAGRIMLVGTSAPGLLDLRATPLDAAIPGVEVHAQVVEHILSQLFEQEVVKTGVASVAQLLFLDQTSLTIGPKAQVKLDKFVFDPNKKVGDVVLSATKGAFRFVSGVQDPHSYTINTPVATIGTRGTIFSGYNFAGGIIIIIIIVEEGAGFTLQVRHRVERRKPRLVF
jgi:adenylate cyclase